MTVDEVSSAKVNAFRTMSAMIVQVKGPDSTNDFSFCISVP
jgi:hypothetical protein